MTKLYTLILSLSFFAATAQTETTTDTIFSNNTAIGILKKIGTGYVVYSADGKTRLISIKENYYHFPNGRSAYPDVTVRSADATIQVILSNGLLAQNGLNETKVNEFISRYATPLPVQQTIRETREEINPEIR